MKKELDEIDRNILRILQEDARKSYRDIQQQLGISIGTIHNRIAKLKKRKIIEGYTLKLNNEKLGYKLSFLIRIDCDGKFTEEILGEIAKIPEVCNVFHTTGEQSAALICRFKESDQVHDFIRKLNAKEYVKRTVSNMILKEYKNSSFVEI
ncbi:MAG: Lrp/AsnC family transcriptional regulator [Candidatus Thorarchaeota archaeon]